MGTPDTATYPRPDFQRRSLHWTSLNGPWDFLFDDEDTGLVDGWHKSGLPNRVIVGNADAPSGDAQDNDDSESITQKIAANPENLLKDNKFGSGIVSYEKRKIIVPFVFQTRASTIYDRNAHEVVWYERAISDFRTTQELESRSRVLLRCGAIDYEATVWVDGHYVGAHRGGHVLFDIDITDSLHPSKESRLTIRVRDSVTDLTQPRGKQYWAAKPESIFYTPSTGIWQSVWLECVPTARIADSGHGTVLRSDDIENGDLKAVIAVLGKRVGQKYYVELEGSLEGVVVVKTKKEALSKGSHTVALNVNLRLSDDQIRDLPKSLLDRAPLENDRCWLRNLALWTPEHPLQYAITIRLFDHADNILDEVETTTGMRSLSWMSGDSTFRLNNRPYFQVLVLDQGYWPDTGITPPTAMSLKADIELSKDMGFNGCRKHQKVEDPIFLYWADKLGYLVWGEMANGYQFSAEYVDRFDQEWVEAVRRDINHPSIVTWTPVNETWGYPELKDDEVQQNHIRSLYHKTQTLDPTRPINDNCGWEHVCNDLTTFHDYADAPELAKTCASMDGILSQKANRDIFVGGTKHRPGAPVICTEFGGVNITPGKDAGERDWGYTTATDPDDLLRRVEGLVMGIVKGGHCCGLVYTQLSDIEQEVNGLYSFDRRAKLDVGKVKAIMEEAKKVYFSQLDS